MKEFKTFDDKNRVTANYLQFCYMCDDRHLCTTEESCRQCWADQNLDTEGTRSETQKLMCNYYV